MATLKHHKSFVSDRRTFSTYERQFLSAWFKHVATIWQKQLHKSYGMTDEGEGWLVVSSDTPEGVSTVAAISIEVQSDNTRVYRYFCGPRRLSFLGSSLIDVMKKQSPDGMFEAFPQDFDTEGFKANVVQLIPTT